MTTAAAAVPFPAVAVHHRHHLSPHQHRRTSTTIRTSVSAFTSSRAISRSRLRGNESVAASGEATSEADRIVDGMDFGELCNEFECISSPQVESTARQLARDIFQLRQGNRALGTFAVSVTYKDPVRSFTGRDKYKRPLWFTDALQNPTPSVREMVMLSTSLLRIRWTVRGKPKSFAGALLAGELIIKVNSEFTLNQISGQVIEHRESWDLSASSPPGQAFFWASRRLFATVEAGRDLGVLFKDLGSRISPQKDSSDDIYPDPSGDPTKFFQTDDSFQRDAYQIALFLAVVYLVFQFLKITL
ncbi:unnamed protein product [Linum tenue]|uniref:AT1G65230-like protein n=1 Tax=Linum tenue TaxID=586396 RepID=A0AAV0GVS7_9ROSI|nr:unnamed protein product [Linum tenue]